MQVVQGTLEQPMAVQQSPVPAGSQPVLDDPFAELDAIAATPEPVVAGTPVQAPPQAVADPFSELDDLAVNSVGASVPGSQDPPHEAPVSVADPFSELDDLALAATERAIAPLPAAVDAAPAPGNPNLSPEAPMSVADPFSELDDLALATTEPAIGPLSVPMAADPAPAPPADPFAELDSLSASAPSSSFEGPDFEPEDVGDLEIEEMELEELDIEEAEGGEFPSFDQDHVLDPSGVPDLGESAEAAPLDSFPAPATPEELAAAGVMEEAETGRVGELTFDFSESEEESAIASLDLGESPPASASPDALGATLDEAAIGSVDDDVETAPGISVLPDVAQQDESSAVSQVEHVAEVAAVQEAAELDLELGSDLDEMVAAVGGLDESALPEMSVEEETPVLPPEMPMEAPVAPAPEIPVEAVPSSAMADGPPPAVEKLETKGPAGSGAMAALLSRVGLGKDKVEKPDQESSDAAARMDALVESVSGEFDAVPEPAEATEDEAVSFKEELVAAGLNLGDPAIRMVLSVLVRRGVCEQELLDSLNEED